MTKALIIIFSCGEKVTMQVVLVTPTQSFFSVGDRFLLTHFIVHTSAGGGGGPPHLKT